MKCADPVLCYRGPSKTLYRHFSLANSTFKLIANQVFNCGKCIFCRKKRAKELALRCVLHASLYPQNSFLTLTYDETKKGYHNQLQYSDIQKFKKSLRRYCEYHFHKKIQVFNVHEYGKNGKKHWHLVVFNHDFSEDRTLFTVKNNNSLFISKKLEKLWPHGIHTIGSVTEASAMYQAQYTQKDFKNGNQSNDKKSNSKHSGIGKDYFLTHYRQILSLGYIPFSGKKIPIPRYFEKLAHKHYAHFYDQSYFFDTFERKKRYSPFKNGESNKEIADLYIKYSDTKNEITKQLEQEWEDFIHDHVNQPDNIPAFILSEENYQHDLLNKTNRGKF